MRKSKRASLDPTTWAFRSPQIDYWAIFEKAFPEVDRTPERMVTSGYQSRVSKDLIYERAELVARVKKLIRQWETVVDLGVQPNGPDTDLAFTWSHQMIKETYEVGLFLSNKAQLRRLAGYGRKSGPRTRTPDLAAEARELYSLLHERVSAGKKDYTKHKNSRTWARRVIEDDKERPGKPKIPRSIIIQLPYKSPRQLALEWTADKLKERHPGLITTDNSVRGLLNTAAKADTAGD